MADQEARLLHSGREFLTEFRVTTGRTDREVSQGETRASAVLKAFGIL